MVDCQGGVEYWGGVGGRQHIKIILSISRVDGGISQSDFFYTLF